MKTHVLIISRYFPKTHSKGGQDTDFLDKIFFNKTKKHTIRGNYNLWKKRIDEVLQGKAIISLRYWSGKPYNSKQVEITQFNQTSYIGIQKLFFEDNCIDIPIVFVPGVGAVEQSIETIANNDGLTLPDFKEWFAKADLSEPMAIIHFTDFRY
ncbi:MAG: hypothetical protein EOP00_11600 [Pedobacter sp.]|nr:MAG: hypothetical protein EOP00_11600 [Pedobacter sp.]